MIVKYLPSGYSSLLFFGTSSSLTTFSVCFAAAQDDDSPPSHVLPRSCENDKTVLESDKVPFGAIDNKHKNNNCLLDQEDEPFEKVQAGQTTTRHWNLPSPYYQREDKHPIGSQQKWNSDVITNNSGIMYTVPNAASDECFPLPTKNNDTVVYHHRQDTEKTAPKSSPPIPPPNQKMTSERTLNVNNNKNDDDDDDDDKSNLIYKSGIPTLRSSAHRVKFSVKGRKQDPKPRDSSGKETKTTWLPDPLLKEDVVAYDTNKYNLQAAVVSLLQECDPEIVGSFVPPPTTNIENEESRPASLRLEDFRVPVKSTWRKVNDGCCESAQKYLSDAVSSNDAFLETFDRFVQEVILPYLKRRLINCDGDCTDEQSEITFYYQRPPTLRLQPGPGWAKVKPHNDAIYGHQNGELNFWIPLTDRELNGVDLWCETAFQADDYHPVPASVGEVVAFHGSSCRHYVNPNETENTRVSLDFRIGVQKYFDPFWTMRGTTDDHGRKEITL